MALLKVSLQTLKTVISCDLTWHAGVGWEAYFVMFSFMFVSVKIITWHLQAASAAQWVLWWKNVGMWSYSSILGKCFGHIEKWLGPNVTMGSLLKLCLLGYQTNLTNVPKHDCVLINLGIVAAACWFPKLWKKSIISKYQTLHLHIVINGTTWSLCFKCSFRSFLPGNEWAISAYILGILLCFTILCECVFAFHCALSKDDVY